MLFIWLLIGIVVVVGGFIVGKWLADSELGVIVAVVTGTACFIIGVIIVALIEVQLDAQCKSAGWREGSYNPYSGVRYCITRSDQTDIIRPLDEALRNSK